MPKFNASKDQTYTKRGFLIPHSTDLNNLQPRRVFVEWDKKTGFRVGLEELTDSHGWVTVGGSVNVMQTEQSMWEMAEAIWMREGGA